MAEPAQNEQDNTSTSPSGRRVCAVCTSVHLLTEVCSSPSSSASSSPSSPFSKKTSGVLDSLVGKTVDNKYQILSFLGKGGMSVVYKAKQMPINRTVAVKMLLGHLAQDESSVLRFLQEARAAGQLAHPNVVGIFDFGVWKEANRPDTPYLVMDYLEGQTLQQILKHKKRLPPAEAVPIFLEICDGMAAAHDRNIVHRDMKPSNILLQEVPGGQVVRLVDFGIAKMIDLDSQHLTKTGEVFGSPLYMSPEQCDATRDVDFRSDMYSLGIVFYETIAGELPLSGKTSLETMALQMKAIPKSFQSISAELQIPIELENIIFKMMAKESAKRYSSMLEVKQALQNFVAGENKALSGQIVYVGREISRKATIIKASIICAVVIVLLGVIALLSLPYGYGFLSERLLEKGTNEYQINQPNQAISSLRQAIDFSEKTNNVALQSKALALLIQIYKDEGMLNDLESARSQRRELIRRELKQFDLGQSSVDNIVNVSAKIESTSIQRDVTSAASNDKSDLLNAKKPNTKTDADVSNANESDSDVDERPEGKHETARTLSRQISKPMPSPSPSPAPVSGSAIVVDERLAIPNLTPTPMSSQPSPSSQLATLLKSNQDSKSSVLANVPMAKRKMDSLKSLFFRNTEKDSDKEKQRPSSTTASAGFSNNYVEPEVKDIGVPITLDSLDKLEVLSQMYIEDGLFDKAEEASSKAIALYRQLGCSTPETELQLFVNRAWARLNQKHYDSAQSDLSHVLNYDLSSSTQLAAQAQAQAAAISASLFAEQGNLDRAAKAFALMPKVKDACVSPESKALLNLAIAKYNAISK